MEQVVSSGNGLGNVQGKGKVTAFMTSYQLMVHVDLAALIYGAKVQQKVAARVCVMGRFPGRGSHQNIDREGALITQSLTGHQLTLYTG